MQEKLFFIITALWFALVTINVNQYLGTVYLAAFLIVTMIMFSWDKKQSIPLNRGGNIFIGLIQGALVYVIFVVVNSVLLPFLSLNFNISSILSLLSSSTPVLASSKILNTLTYVIFIPFAETIFFVVLMDLIATFYNFDISKKGLTNLRTLGLVFALSFIFVLYHINVKGIANNEALIMVFLMMFISLLSAIFFGESKQAVIFHMIANAFGIGILSSIPMLLSFSPFVIFSNKFIWRKKWRAKEKVNGLL